MCFSRTKYFNDHSKYSLKWFGWKIIKTIFTPPPLLLQHHYVLTGPRNGSYTLGHVILARKLPSSCTTRTKYALTILRTASTWTRPTRHWCHTQFRSILYEGWDKLYWNTPDFALDDHVWQQHVVVLSPSGGRWMRQHERGGCLWCEPYNCRH